MASKNQESGPQARGPRALQSQEHTQEPLLHKHHTSWEVGGITPLGPSKGGGALTLPRSLSRRTLAPLRIPSGPPLSPPLSNPHPSPPALAASLIHPRVLGSALKGTGTAPSLLLLSSKFRLAGLLPNPLVPTVFPSLRDSPPPVQQAQGWAGAIFSLGTELILTH